MNQIIELNHVNIESFFHQIHVKNYDQNDLQKMNVHDIDKSLINEGVYIYLLNENYIKSWLLRYVPGFILSRIKRIKNTAHIHYEDRRIDFRLELLDDAIVFSADCLIDCREEGRCIFSCNHVKIGYKRFMVPGILLNKISEQLLLTIRTELEICINKSMIQNKENDKESDS